MKPIGVHVSRGQGVAPRAAPAEFVFRWRAEAGARFIVHSIGEGAAKPRPCLYFRVSAAGIRLPAAYGWTAEPRMADALMAFTRHLSAICPLSSIQPSPRYWPLTQRETGDRIVGWGQKHFRVPGLGRRVPGAGIRVRVQVRVCYPLSSIQPSPRY